MIEVHQLTKTYDDIHKGKFVAVDELSFQANSGEIFGLLGPNGAGKNNCLAHPQYRAQPNVRDSAGKRVTRAT